MNISRRTRLPLILGPMLLIVAACGGGGGGGGGGISTGDDNAIMENILVKVGGSNAALLPNTPLPASSSNIAAPKATPGFSAATAEPGDAVTVPIAVQAENTLQRLCAKVGGASSSLCANLAPAPTARTLYQEAKSASGEIPSKQLADTTTLNFELNLPRNVEPDGAFCVNLTVEDNAGLVSNTPQVCLTVVADIARTENDQPTTPAAVESALAGEWEGACVADGNGGSVKLGFEFGSPRTYVEFLRSWSTNAACTGAPTSAIDVVLGTYTPGAPEFNEQLRLWQLPFDFIPQQLNRCFNVLRVSGNQFFLGVPIGFTAPGSADTPGSCVSTASRPVSIATAAPFTRVSTAPAANMPPLANAGADRRLNLPAGSSVNLDGRGSGDSDGQIASFAWVQTAGPNVELSGANTAQPGFAVPPVQQSTVLSFRLSVTDDDGASATDTVAITIDAGSAAAAQVSAGPDQSVASNETVSLRGTATPEGEIASIQWTAVDNPSLPIQNANQLNASFTAPRVASGTQLLNLRLTVAFSGGQSISDQVLIEVAPVQLSSGELRFTLTWDQANDLDLYVREPSGTEISFPSDCTVAPSDGQPASGCAFSPNGGALDVDDTNGFGPENIFYPATPQDGIYCFAVRHFTEAGSGTNYTLRVSAGGGQIDQRTGTVSTTGNRVDYFIATRTAGSYSFRVATPNDAAACPGLEGPLP